MDLIIELRISNINDWAIIQPLLKRLKIHFVQKTFQKQNDQSQSIPDVQKDVAVLQALQQHPPAIVWSAYDSPKAAETLLQLLDNSNH